MNKEKVKSSNIKLVGYDQPSKILEIEFTNGSVYQYFNVPESEYNSFINSESIGGFFFKSIRTKYKFELISKSSS